MTPTQDIREMRGDDGGIIRREHRINGVKSRDARLGPALEVFYPDGSPKCTQYLQAGELHRPRQDGPAYEIFNEAGAVVVREFWVRGVKVPAPLFVPLIPAPVVRRRRLRLA